MKPVAQVVLLTLLLLLGACSKDGGAGPAGEPEKGVSVGNGRGENFLEMDADLTDAISLTATIPKDPTKEDKRLMKVTSSNKFEEVLGGKHKLFNFKITPTHIIAHVNINEGEGKAQKHCSLIAIPKIQGKSPVLCLNRELLNCTQIYSNRNQVGYDVRGSEVYFTYHEVLKKQDYNPYDYMYCDTSAKIGENAASYSELRHWDGKSEKVETLFHSEPEHTSNAQMMVRDVFASKSNGNLCIDTDNTGKASVYCRKAGEVQWENIKDMETFYSDTPYLAQNNKLLADGKTNSLDLETFELKKRDGVLPYSVDFKLENGGMVGRSGSSVIYVLPDGNSSFVFSLDSKVAPARVGNWAWYMSGGSLRRLNLNDGKVDEKDYFSNTTLLRLSALYWTLGDFLRADGINRSGMPGKSYLATDGALLYVEATAIAVEHPIDLKWDK